MLTGASNAASKLLSSWILLALVRLKTRGSRHARMPRHQHRAPSCWLLKLYKQTQQNHHAMAGANTETAPGLHTLGFINVSRLPTLGDSCTNQAHV
jgi:hypothetical protein